MPRPPRAFVSYSWDDDPHKAWVRTLAQRLRADGVEVRLDQWETVPGDQLPEYMERSIRENQFVLIVCTPPYKARSDSRRGGVGYEGDIMTAEVYATAKHRKFIPILRIGDWSAAAPSWLSGKYRVDLRGDPYSETQYGDLLSTLHNVRAAAPPVGKPFSTTRAARGARRPTALSRRNGSLFASLAWSWTTLRSPPWTVPEAVRSTPCRSASRQPQTGPGPNSSCATGTVRPASRRCIGLASLG